MYKSKLAMTAFLWPIIKIITFALKIRHVGVMSRETSEQNNQIFMNINSTSDPKPQLIVLACSRNIKIMTLHNWDVTNKFKCLKSHASCQYC